MGKSVSWNGATRTITLSGGSQVTDADSFGPSGIPATTNPTTPNSGLVSEETAKAKALTHAGLTASQVTFLRCKLVGMMARQVYDVEFYTKDYKEYDYEIDARTGRFSPMIMTRRPAYPSRTAVPPISARPRPRASR